MMGTPRTGDKSAIQNFFYCSVSQIHINLEKTRKKHKNDFFEVHTLDLV